MAGLRERLLSRLLCLAACISLNQRLGRPSRALVDYCVRSCGRGGEANSDTKRNTPAPER